ncbi:MAG TPA: hypothetical protein VFE12_09715 [Acetobacteraceae bacterium]|nr:hypothetical protein [Acetobacteraceae bacterium]
MAMALEDVAAGVVDSALGPWALVVGAGAFAVAFATRPARPVSRIVTGGVVAMDATGRISPRRWMAALRQGLNNLVDEARREYEAERQRPPLTPELAADVVAAAAPAPATNGERVLVASEAAATSADAAADAQAEVNRKRDARGRFIRRSPNGTATA